MKKVSKTVVAATNMGKKFGWLKINFNCQKVVLIKIAPALGELFKKYFREKIKSTVAIIKNRQSGGAMAMYQPV